jgi:hypothetical protein
MRLLLFLLLLAPSAFGASVSLEWDANSETNLASYALYWGTASRTYQFSSSIPAPMTRITVFDLSTNTTYYFAVTARTDDGLESDYSAEISYLAPFGPPPPPPPTNQTTITVTLEEGLDVLGPWVSLSNTFTVVVPADPQRFYRARMDITRP